MKPSPLRHSEQSPEMHEAFEKMRIEREERLAALPKIRADGEAALRRLLPIAQGNSGQCRYIAEFLLSLYHGGRFPFDLTNLRGLDYAIFEDCLAVLRMDHTALKEVHMYFDKGNHEGNAIWEELARSWGIKDHLIAH